MGLFDELMRNAGKRGTAIAEADIKRKAEKEEYAARTASEAARYAAMGDRADARYIEKADSTIDRVLANPNGIDATAAALAEQHSTVTKKPKYNKYGTKTEAVDASMNGTPLAGIGDRIKNVYATKLQDSKGTGKSVVQIQQEAVSEVMTPELVQASYEHKAKADSSITNLFGLFGDNSGVKAADGKALGMVGYDTWKARVKADREKKLADEHAGLGIASTDNEQLRQDAINASIGAAGSLVAGGMVLAAPTAGTSLVPTVGGAAVLIGGSLLRGALMAGTGRIASAVARAYEKTDFATFHEGDAQERGFGAVVGGLALAAGAKGSGLKTMTGMGTAGAAIGAASPTTAVDFLGWTGAQAVADKGGEMALKRFANLGARSETALNNLAHDPTGAKVVEKFRADKALAGAKEAIDLETLKTAAEKTLYEAEFARMEKGKALTDVLARRKLSMMPNETGATVNKSLREADGDVVSLAQELQDARRMATPGGPNAVSVAAPVVKKTGRGKGKKAAAVDAEEQQQALEKAHFNAFLDEQKEAGLAVRRQAEATQEVYSKLFAVANRPTDLSEGLSKLSWDGLNKVIGEGAKEGWKVLSIGERVQIVNGAESAAHAALMRGKSTVAGADRLDSLAGSLVKAVREGMKGAPEDLSNALQKVVERKGSPYVKNGQTDLQTLQTDLADHGFESVQQLAFTLAKDKPKASVKKLAAFEEATTAIRNSFGSNLVKLGSGIIGAGALGLTESPEWQEAFNNATVAADVTIPKVKEDTTPDLEHAIGRSLGDGVLNLVESIGEKLDPLVSLLGPAEAEAGGFDAAVKLFGNLKTSRAAAAVLADAGKSGTEALRYAHDAGLVFTELPKGAVSARGHRVGYIDTAPNGTAEMKEIVRRLSNVVPGQGFATPYFNSQTLLKTANDGDRFLGNPAIQLAHGQSAVSHNARQTLAVLDNIYKVNGVKLSKANSTAIETAMLPVQKAYDAVSTPLRASEAAAGHLRKELKYLTETSAKDAEFAANMAPAIEAKKAALAAAEDEIKALRPAFNDAKADVEIYQRAMAMRFPEARLSLAVEDTADFAQRPWLRELLTPGEKQAVLQIQDVMAEYGERITAIMGKDSVITGGYVKHSRTFLPEQAKRLSDLEAKLDKLGLNGKETLALTKLHERTLYSQQMIPDIGRNMADYVPDVEKRLMNADFWNKWKPFKDSTTVKNSPALKGMFDRIAESARPAEDTALRRFSSNYAKVETIRLLTGLASAPAKHLFKVLGDVSQLGLLNTASVMADAAGMGMRNFVRIQGQKLAKAGFISEETAAGLFTKNKDVDSFVAAIINQRGMVDYLSDLEKTYGVGHRSTIDKILDPLTEVAGMGIKIVETFDRTVSVLAAAKMAQKSGLTGQQAMYGIYDTILKNNFLSGQLNSAWAKDPNVRALFLFQNTPFKIWERRVANASIAGTDLKTALGVIKAQDLPAAKAELEGMRKWAAQASQAFKNGMLMDALNSSKDVFGNSVSGQFVREALGVGVVLGAGSMAGVNLTGHLLHTPFVGAGFSGAPEVSMSPLVKAGFNTVVGKKPAGFDDWDSDDHNHVADFFKHWYGTAGYSLMASKFGRISSGDIPEQYRDSKFKFLFAMPATAEK